MQFDFLSTWQTAIFAAGTGLLNSFAVFLPNLIGAILVFIFGWLIAGFLARLTVRFLQAIRLSQLVESPVLNKFLKEAGWANRIEHALGQAIRFFTILVFFVAAVNLLGLTAVSLVLTGILTYIPNVIAAILILVMGTLFAGVVESVVKGSLGAVDLQTSRLLGKTSSYIVLVFTILAALSQLNIAAEFVQTIFLGIVATISIGLGLSLGLGSKDLVSKVLNQWYEDFKRDTRK
jgi:hypothetical protein